MGPNYKEDKELILYPNKGGKVSDLLEEAAKVVEMSPEGSGRYVYSLHLQYFHTFYG